MRPGRNRIVCQFLTAACLASAAPKARATSVSITMDDPNQDATPLYSAAERNDRILATLDRFGSLKAALFVCGMRVDDAVGKAAVKLWSDRGHLIGNHSYSHLYFHSAKVTLDQYVKDFLAGEAVIKDLPGFRRFYRFPFLKEGDTAAKRDGMRQVLRDKNYRHGYVTIDASDWYVDGRLRKRLKANPKADTTSYRDFYLKHIWNRATFYDGLAKKVVGKEVKHTLLIHHSLLNAMYLGDLLKMFESKGWKLVNAADAFDDPGFNPEPNILPAGESILWGLAKESGKFEDVLRYPGEDGDYEKKEMDEAGL